MYRLFVTDPDFDAVLDGSSPAFWLQQCEYAESMEVILNNQALDFDLRPLQAKFELASKLTQLPAALFLRCLGMHATDRRLASLKSSSGMTVLHCIGQRLRTTGWLSQRSDELREWIHIGSSVLKHGADLFGITTGDGLWGKTPLLEWLCSGQWDLKFGFETTLKGLHLSAEMLQEAGIDLCEYGECENEVWKSLGAGYLHQLEDCMMSGTSNAVRLIYGAAPNDWSLAISRCWSIDVYRLQPPPGAFLEEVRVPTTIAWSPTNDEMDEGPWALFRNEERVTNDVDIRDLIDTPAEHFTDLVGGCQDDSGVVMLRQGRTSRTLQASSRSHSQPPCLRRREVAYRGVGYPVRRNWLANYHLCPFDSRWRFGCIQHGRNELLADGTLRQVFDVRSCVKGVSRTGSCVQQTQGWRDHSFLASIAHCQDGIDYWWYPKDVGSNLRHTYTKSCPQGCKNVHLDRLNVPEDLRPYHPRRKYEDEDEQSDSADD